MKKKELTQGDTTPVTFKRFRDEAGNPIPTNQVQAVRFSIKLQGAAEPAVSRANCSITSEGTDPLTCEWQPGDADLAVAGLYEAELEITYQSQKIKHYPERAGDFLITVREKVA